MCSCCVWLWGSWICLLSPYTTCPLLPKHCRYGTGRVNKGAWWLFQCFIFQFNCFYLRNIIDSCSNCKGWNLPSTVLLNHHTCSTYNVDVRNILYAKIISVDVQYPNKLLHNNGKWWTLHAKWSWNIYILISYYTLSLPRNNIKTCNKQLIISPWQR